MHVARAVAWSSEEQGGFSIQSVERTRRYPAIEVKPQDSRIAEHDRHERYVAQSGQKDDPFPAQFGQHPPPEQNGNAENRNGKSVAEIHRAQEITGLALESKRA